MHHIPLKERGFDDICLITGKIGRAFGFRSKQPVFIIGTGRCGTSLLVKILNSHPSLSGFPGEANELWHPRLEPFESATIDMPPIEVDPRHFSEVSIANWPPKQGERIRDIFTGFNIITGLLKTYFIKSAMISFMIPKILDIFPDAKFIHIYRFGPAVVESYFKKNFGKYSVYVFTENEYRIYCAKYWNACILEIEKKKNELLLETKGRFLEFSYEDLCQNPKDILEDISRFLEVAPGDFSFDTSQISNQNVKVRDYTKKTECIKLLDLMSQGLKLKGYIPEFLLV